MASLAKKTLATLAVALPGCPAAASGEKSLRLDPSVDAPALGTARLRIVDGVAKAERVADYKSRRDEVVDMLLGALNDPFGGGHMGGFRR